MADTKPNNATHAEWVVVNMLELPEASKTLGVIVGAVVGATVSPRKPLIRSPLASGREMLPSKSPSVMFSTKLVTGPSSSRRSWL
jgi:hypothetical protein